MNRIGNLIKELRIKKGWSQDDLAERMGMNRVNISNYETGKIKNIPSDALKKFCDYFGVTSDYLLGKTDNDDKPESEFFPRIELTEKNSLKQFTFVLDGEQLSEEEMRVFIAFIRTTRQMKN